MKIAMLTDSFTDGGGLAYIRQVVEGMPQHTFVVCGLGGSATGALMRLPNALIESAGYGPAIVRRHCPDLLHFNHLRPLAAHCLCPGSLPLPSINTVHGIHLRRYDFLRAPWYRLAAIARRLLERHCLAKVSLNIALTESDRDYLITQLGVRRVEVIPNGVAALDPAQIKPVPRTAKVHFLVPARFDFQKGHDVLLRAIALEKDGLISAGAQFDLLGDGPLRPAMERLAMRLGVDGLVRFHGFQSNVADWMASTDCVILPSRWEGLPFVLLEAGRLACAVICSDASGNIDVADHGRCATLFRNGDALDLAAKLSQYIASGVASAVRLALQSHVERVFTMPQMLRQLGALYTSIQAGGR